MRKFLLSCAILTFFNPITFACHPKKENFCFRLSNNSGKSPLKLTYAEGTGSLNRSTFYSGQSNETVATFQGKDNGWVIFTIGTDDFNTYCQVKIERSLTSALWNTFKWKFYKVTSSANMDCILSHQKNTGVFNIQRIAH